MSNVFSSDAFLDVFSRTFYPGRPARPCAVAVGGKVFRLLGVDDAIAPMSDFVDFYEPVAAEAEARAGYLPRVSIEAMTVAEWEASGRGRGGMPAPFVTWRRRASWEEWRAYFDERSRAVAKETGSRADVPRQRRRIERELGPLRLVAEDDARLLTPFFEWKSARLRAMGAKDPWVSERNVRLLQNLAAARLLKIAALRAGDRVIALHAGLEQDGRLYWWLATYDPGLGTYSPGRILLDALLEHHFRNGQREFDFLNGGEAYKWCYATDVRVVGPLGVPSLAQRARTAGKHHARRLIQASVPVLSCARSVQRFLQRRGIG